MFEKIKSNEIQCIYSLIIWYDSLKMTLINCHIDFILGFIHYFLNDFLHVRHIKVYWSIFSCVRESRKGFSKRLKHCSCKISHGLWENYELPFNIKFIKSQKVLQVCIDVRRTILNGLFFGFCFFFNYFVFVCFFVCFVMLCFAWRIITPGI